MRCLVKNFINKYKVLLGSVIIATPIFIYLLLAVIPATPGIGKEAWVGFFGSFLGGLFGGIATMYAVFSTLKDNKDREDKSKKLSIIPYINAEIEFEENNKETTYFFKFSNVGLGTAIELTINKEIEYLDSVFKSKFPNLKNQMVLPVNGFKRIRYSAFKKQVENSIETFSIEYWDVTKTHKYEQTIDLLYTYTGVTVISISKQEEIT